LAITGRAGAGTSAAASDTFGYTTPNAGMGPGHGGAALNASNARVEGASAAGLYGTPGGVYNPTGNGGNGSSPSNILSGGHGIVGSGGSGGAGGGADPTTGKGYNGGNGGFPGGGGGGGAGGLDDANGGA